jgi:membrane-bound serine protease (ClpP class)
MTHRRIAQYTMLGRLLAAVALALTSWMSPVVSAQPETPVRIGGTTAAILPLRDEITDVTVESLRRRIDMARTQGAKLIILDMDTPGGLVTSSIAIADLIRSLTDVKTVAWVNPNAHSGGALVAMACDEIVMARSSRIGDSQVIMGGPTGVTAVPEDLRAKAYTPVLHDFRTSARKNGYSQALCEALVIPEREVWWLENVKTGEREFVFHDEKVKRLGEDKPSPPTSAENVDVAPPPEPEWKLVQKYYDPVLSMEVPTLQPIVHDDQLLEMSPSEAIAFGFSKGIVTDEGDLRTRYGLGTLIRLKPLWSESLALWLTSLYVRGFLLVVIFLAGYVEFHTPGLSLAGLVALIALAIFVGAPYLTGLANVWEIVLILAGLLLICLELFVIPGFGVAGISGVMMVLTGLIATFIPDEPGRSFPQLFPALPTTIEGLKLAVVTLVSSMTASLIGMLMLSRFLPRIPIFSKLVPANPTPSQVAVEDPYIGMARVGDIGQAEGTLRPAGKARFGSMLVDVVTQGEYLEANCPIEVIERRGNRVVVRAVQR